MSKEIYKSAFAIMKTQNNICNQFEDMGFRFEYGQGFMGEALEELLNNSYAIIKASMNFNCKTIHKTIFIGGCPQNVSFDVFYLGEYDENWVITEDDFSDFVHFAINSEKMQEWFWQAMVEKNETAKEQFNKATKMFQIGRHWKD